MLPDAELAGEGDVFDGGDIRAGRLLSLFLHQNLGVKSLLSIFKKTSDLLEKN